MKKHNSKYRQQNKNIIKANTFNISKKKNWLILYIIISFLVPVLFYLQTINFGLTRFDDDIIISKNISFLNDFKNAKKAFTTDAFITTNGSLEKRCSFYRPLQTISYMTDIHLSEKNGTWMFHLSNILLLGLITCLLFLLLRKLLIPTKFALLSNLIFCLNPLFVSNVAWIPARGDLLLIFFSLLSFLFFIEFLQKKNLLFLILNWITFTIALFCKETAAFLPLTFFLYYITYFSKRSFDKIYLLNLALYIVSVMFWLWLRNIAIGGISNPNDKISLILILGNLRTIPESLTKFFLPVFSAPIPSYSILKTFLGLVIIGLIIIIFIKNKMRSKKEKAFWLTWFLILMFPPMIYKHPYIDYLDHRFFLPLIGVFIFVLFIIPKNWFEKTNIKRILILTCVFITLGSLTVINSRCYYNPMFFYNSAISRNTNSAFAYNNRGLLKVERNNLKDAIEDYNKAIEINPKIADVYVNRGLAKSYLKNYLGAIDDYNKSIAINQNYAETYNNKGIALGSINNLREAIINFNKAIEINPDYSIAYLNRAITKYNLKDLIGTIDDCDKAIKLNPNYTEALNFKVQVQEELRMNRNIK